MPDQKYPQFAGKVLLSRADDASSVRPLGAGWQDKRGASRARTDSQQPASPANAVRAQTMSRGSDRSHRRPRPKRQTVQLTLWVKPIVKTKLQEIAEGAGVSVSKSGSALLEKAVQQHVDMEYGTLLTPAFEAIVDQRLSKRDARLAHLLVRNAFASEQTRILVTNILSRMPGVTDKLLNDILDRAADAAKSKIAQRTPQLADILTALEAMLSDAEERENKSAK